VLEDTSQLANFCNWRNETMQVSGEPKEYAERVLLSEKGVKGVSTWSWQHKEDDCMRSQMPMEGVLETDYVSTNVTHRRLGIEAVDEDIFNWMVSELRQVWRTVRVVLTDEEVKKNKLRHTSVHVARKRRRHPVHASWHVASFDEEFTSAMKCDIAALVLTAVARGFICRIHQRLERKGRPKLQDARKKWRAMTRLQVAKFEHERSEEVSRIQNTSKKRPGQIKPEHVSRRVKLGDDHARRSQRMMKLAGEVLEKRYYRGRPPWWIPLDMDVVHGVEIVESAEERVLEVATRMLRMIRRTTFEHYVSAEQLYKLIDEVLPQNKFEAAEFDPSRLVVSQGLNEARVEAIVILWGRLVDGEMVDFPRMCHDKDIDLNDDGLVMYNELNKGAHRRSDDE
jgi:hypothetical protein